MLRMLFTDNISYICFYLFLLEREYSITKLFNTHSRDSMVHLNTLILLHVLLLLRFVKHKSDICLNTC